MFYLDHFSLDCIIKMLNLKVNDPLKENLNLSSRVQSLMVKTYYQMNLKKIVEHENKKNLSWNLSYQKKLKYFFQKINKK